MLKIFCYSIIGWFIFSLYNNLSCGFDISTEQKLDEYEVQQNVHSDVMIEPTWPVEPYRNTLYLSFTPEELSITSSLCVRITETIDIKNMHADRSIRIISVTFNSNHDNNNEQQQQQQQFQVTNFKSVYLGPSDFVTISITFIPQFIGKVKTTMILRTSDGEVEYMIHSHAQESIYRLTPLLDNRIAESQSKYIPIVIYNPHPESLHILDVSSSNPFVQLNSIPTSNSNYYNDKDKDKNDNEDGDNIWEISSHREKEIISLLISSDVIGYRLGYIDVILSNYDNISIPIEVYVVEGGLESIPTILDFGTMLTAEQRPINLTLLNTGKEDILVTSISTRPHDIHIDITNIISLPFLIPASNNSYQQYMLGIITYISSHPDKVGGSVMITTQYMNNKTKSSIIIPYQGVVLHGGIGFDKEASIIYIPNIKSEYKSIVRFISFTNHFNTNVSLIEISMESCQPYISILDFHRHSVTSSLSMWPSVKMQVDLKQFMKYATTLLPYKCNMEIETNISSHTISMYILDGTIPLTYLNQKKNSHHQNHRDEVDMGIIWPGESRPLLIAITNPNPVPIKLSWSICRYPIRCCVCLDTNWPSTTLGKVNISEQLTNILIPRLFSSALNDKERCNCAEPYQNINENESIHHMTTINDSLFPSKKFTSTIFNIPVFIEIYPQHTNLFSIVYENATDLDSACSKFTIDTFDCNFEIMISSPSNYTSMIDVNYSRQNLDCINVVVQLSNSGLSNSNNNSNSNGNNNSNTNTRFGSRVIVVGQSKPFIGMILRNHSVPYCQESNISLMKVFKYNHTMFTVETADLPIPFDANNISVFGSSRTGKTDILWQGVMFGRGFWNRMPTKTIWQHSQFLLKTIHETDYVGYNHTSSNSNNNSNSSSTITSTTVAIIDDLYQQLSRMEAPWLLIQSWFQATIGKDLNTYYQFQMHFDTFVHSYRSIKESWKNLFRDDVNITTEIQISTQKYVSIHKLPMTFTIISPLSLFPSLYTYEQVSLSMDETITWFSLEVTNTLNQPIVVSLMTRNILLKGSRETVQDSIREDRETITTTIISQSLIQKWRKLLECGNTQITEPSVASPGVNMNIIKKCFKTEKINFDLKTGNCTTEKQSGVSNDGLVQSLHKHSITDKKLVDLFRSDLIDFDKRLIDQFRPIFTVLSTCFEIKKPFQVCSTNTVLQPGQRVYLGPIIMIPGRGYSQSENLPHQSHHQRQSRSSSSMNQIKALQSSTGMLILANNYTGLDFIAITQRTIIPSLSLREVRVVSNYNKSDQSLSTSYQEYSLSNLTKFSYNQSITSYLTTDLIQTNNGHVYGVPVNRQDTIRPIYFNDGPANVIIHDIEFNGRRCNSFYFSHLWKPRPEICSSFPVIIKSNEAVSLKLESVDCVRMKKIYSVTLFLSNSEMNKETNSDGNDFLSKSSSLELSETTLFVAVLSDSSVRECIQHPRNSFYESWFGLSLLFITCLLVYGYCIIRIFILLRQEFLSLPSTDTMKPQSNVLSIHDSIKEDTKVKQEKSSQIPQVNTNKSYPVIESVFPLQEDVTTLDKKMIEDQLTKLTLRTPTQSPAPSERSTNRVLSRTDLALDWHPSSESTVLGEEKPSRRQSRVNSPEKTLDIIKTGVSISVSVSKIDGEIGGGETEEMDKKIMEEFEPDSQWKLMNSPAKTPILDMSNNLLNISPRSIDLPYMVESDRSVGNYDTNQKINNNNISKNLQEPFSVDMITTQSKSLFSSESIERKPISQSSVSMVSSTYSSTSEPQKMTVTPFKDSNVVSLAPPPGLTTRRNWTYNDKSNSTNINNIGIISPKRNDDFLHPGSMTEVERSNPSTIPVYNNGPTVSTINDFNKLESLQGMYLESPSKIRNSFTLDSPKSNSSDDRSQPYSPTSPSSQPLSPRQSMDIRNNMNSKLSPRDKYDSNGNNSNVDRISLPAHILSVSPPDSRSSGMLRSVPGSSTSTETGFDSSVRNRASYPEYNQRINRSVISQDIPSPLSSSLSYENSRYYESSSSVIPPHVVNTQGLNPSYRSSYSSQQSQQQQQQQQQQQSQQRRPLVSTHILQQQLSMPSYVNTRSSPRSSIHDQILSIQESLVSSQVNQNIQSIPPDLTLSSNSSSVAGLTQQLSQSQSQSQNQSQQQQQQHNTNQSIVDDPAMSEWLNNVLNDYL